MKRYSTGILITVLMAMVWGQVVFADGDSREATQNEKAFHQSVSKVLSAALPPCPIGWEMTNDTTRIEELKYVSTGSENYPLQVEYCMEYQDTQRIMEAEQKMSEELMKLVNDNVPVTDERIQDLQAKSIPHDVSVKISVNVNVTSLGIYEDGFQPIASIAGGLAYQSPGEFNPSIGWKEGTTFVFLGKGWGRDPDSEHYMKAVVNKSVPHTAVQTIAVRIKADTARTRQIIEKIDWDALNKLIQN